LGGIDIQKSEEFFENMHRSYRNVCYELPIRLNAYNNQHPISMKNRIVLPINLKEYFSKIYFDKDENSFKFVIKNKPLIVIKYFVNITEYTNFINDKQFIFENTKISFRYGYDNMYSQFEIRTGIKRKMFKELFQILESDNSLNSIYLQSM